MNPNAVKTKKTRMINVCSFVHAISQPERTQPSRVMAKQDNSLKHIAPKFQCRFSYVLYFITTNGCLKYCERLAPTAFIYLFSSTDAEM